MSGPKDFERKSTNLAGAESTSSGQDFNPFLEIDFEELFSIPIDVEQESNSEQKNVSFNENIDSIDDINQLPSPASGQAQETESPLSTFVQLARTEYDAQLGQVDSVPRDISLTIFEKLIPDFTSNPVAELIEQNQNSVEGGLLPEEPPPEEACVGDVTITSDEIDPQDDEISLREAIISANTQSGPIEIHLCEGKYDLSIVGFSEDNALTGDLDIRGNITIIGENKDTTIIDANQIDRIFHVLPNASLTLKNVTLMGGEVNNFSGGGISNQGTLILENVAMLQNQAKLGGAIYNRGVADIMDSSIYDNLAYLNGGGVYNTDMNSQLSISNSNINHNVANGYGGGIANHQGSVLVESSALYHNAGNYIGGGIINLYGDFDLRVSTISNNSASIAGGGIMNLYGESFYIANSTITENESFLTGAGLYSIQPDLNKAVEIYSTIIANNENDLDISGIGLQSLGYNLIGNHDNALIIATVGDQFGSLAANNVLDPHLGPLMDNGGSTLTHALLALSPAINTGNPSDSSVDQRLVLPNGFKDIGAFEFEGVAVSAPSVPNILNLSIGAFSLLARTSAPETKNTSVEINISDVLSGYSDPETFDMETFLSDLENYSENYIPQVQDSELNIVTPPLVLAFETVYDEPEILL